MEQRVRHAVLHTRAQGGAWERTELANDDAAELPCLHSRLTLDELYEGVAMPALRIGEQAFREDEERSAEAEAALDEQTRHLVR